MKAKIYDMGQGFPDWSDLVQDKDGGLYRITGEGSKIHTNAADGGGDRWIEVEVVVADWSEVVDTAECKVHPFPAMCAPCYMEAGTTGEGAGK